MLSTHWRYRHEPSEHALRHFDVLARQAKTNRARIELSEEREP